jgi:hypothetical protein
MRVVRIIVGIVVMLLITGGAAAGVWVLYEHGGSGLPIEVSFADGKGIAPRDYVVYGDQIVGRVDTVTDEDGTVVVTARVATEHASLVREGSRFWIDSRLGSAVLNFDRTASAGAQANPGTRFTGLASRPEPDPALKPPPLARPLSVRPVWLCEVRATITTRIGEQAQQRERKSAGAIVHVSAKGDVLVLCPAWVFEPAGPEISSSYRVEMIGEGTRIARLAHVQGHHALLHVTATAYRESAARLWPNELADGQPLVLADFDGTAYTADLRAGGLDFKGTLLQGNVALVEGVHLAGFALPNVGKASGARWVSLHGAGDAIDTALAKAE